MRIGEKIRELRRQQRLTQDELGELIRIHGRHISRYENGRANPSQPTLERIAQTFDVPLQALLVDDEPLPPPRPPLPRDPELTARFAELAQFPPKAREVALSVLDALILQNRSQSG
ncbi:helix-turn-helix domain-containing protein [Planctomycetota bacterium]